MPVSRNNDRLMVTLPKEVAEKLKRQAEKENRTVSNMIATIIYGHLKPRK